MGFLNLPLLYLDYIKPQRLRFDVVGNAVSGGRNMLGQEVSYEMTGGGFLSCTYGGLWVQRREEHEYITWLAAYLNGSFRAIDVPLKTDWQGPFPVYDRVPAPFATGIPHSDGSLFSDGSGYSQATVWGKVVSAAPLRSGTLRLRIYDAARALRWSDWFSIYHDGNGDLSMGWRSYRNWNILTEHGSGNETIDGTSFPYREYTLAIQPTLREAVAAGQRIEFARPRVASKLMPGTNVLSDVEGFWLSRPTLEFTEAF